MQIVGAGVTLATVRGLTRGQIAADARGQALDLRDVALDGWRRGGAAGVAAVGARPMPQAALLLIDGAGRYRAGNVADWPPVVPARGEATIEIFRIGRSAPERMHVVATPLPGGARLLTGHVVEDALRVARTMEEAMAVAMAVALALAGVAAWFAARMIERRLAATVATADAVARGELARRVPLNGGAAWEGDGFEALAVAVNAMLDRIAALMTELKVATDGLAHDLRSPLTRLRAQLDRALAASDGAAPRAAIERALDEGDRLLAMLDTALRITRAEAGLGRDAFVATDLAALATDIADMFAPLAEDRGMTIVADAPAPLIVAADRELLAQALANLVDNALKYGAGRVVVTARPGCLSVADDGPGIPADRRDEALKRFARLDAARSGGGAGLGLSLAAAVAHLHGGTLVLGDNAPGLVATIRVG